MSADRAYLQMSHVLLYFPVYIWVSWSGGNPQINHPFEKRFSITHIHFGRSQIQEAFIYLYSCINNAPCKINFADCWWCTVAFSCLRTSYTENLQTTDPVVQERLPKFIGSSTKLSILSVCGKPWTTGYQQGSCEHSWSQHSAKTFQVCCDMH